MNTQLHGRKFSQFHDTDEPASPAWFVEPNSVVRQICGRSDLVLFIFAGEAAELALKKVVDWLLFTRRLPVDPLGRLFSAITYARQIVPGDEKSPQYLYRSQVSGFIASNICGSY